MVWVYIALAIPVLFLLLLHFFRVHFSIDVETPAVFRGTVGVSFLWFRREAVVLDVAHTVMGHHEEYDESEEEGEFDESSLDEEVAPAPGTGEGLGPRSDDGQRGAVGIPESWLLFTKRFRVRTRKAFTKWALDVGVWRLLLRFTLKSGRRVLGLLHPALKFMHLGLEDVYDLGRIAAAWSIVQGTIPALACPVGWGFTEPFNFKARLAGGFTGLNVLVFGFLTLFSFPWLPLGSRFLHCWRDPRLNRWQRRVLLP
ncbi:MAG: hypothetical protein JWP91_1525 [Fibrobacteres bacterium]|nr:hypothetical protein [Fibrobacterota bacterium]